MSIRESVRKERVHVEHLSQRNISEWGMAAMSNLRHGMGIREIRFRRDKKLLWLVMLLGLCGIVIVGGLSGCEPGEKQPHTKNMGERPSISFNGGKTWSDM